MAGTGMKRAVLRYGWERFAALARKVIFRLQRLDASGIYGDDYQHKTLWDEFCHEVQWRPDDDQIESAWGVTIRPFLEAVIAPLSDNEKMVLFFATDEADELDEDIVEPVISDDALLRGVLSELQSLAGKRNLDRFDYSRMIRESRLLRIEIACDTLDGELIHHA